MPNEKEGKRSIKHFNFNQKNVYRKFSIDACMMVSSSASFDVRVAGAFIEQLDLKSQERAKRNFINSRSADSLILAATSQQPRRCYINLLNHSGCNQ
jgi:hypothetical protein